MNSENTRAYLAFALVGLMFVLVIALFFVDMPRENSNLINTALGFIAGAMTTACGFYFGSSELEKRKVNPMTTKPFFDAARVIAGGKLTQAQVDELNKVVDKLAPGGKTTSDVGVDLISGFEGTRFKAYDDGVGVWTIGTGTTVYPNGVKVKRGYLYT